MEWNENAWDRRWPMSLAFILLGLGDEALGIPFSNPRSLYICGLLNTHSEEYHRRIDAGLKGMTPPPFFRFTRYGFEAWQLLVSFYHRFLFLFFPSTIILLLFIYLFSCPQLSMLLWITAPFSVQSAALHIGEKNTSKYPHIEWFKVSLLKILLCSFLGESTGALQEIWHIYQCLWVYICIYVRYDAMHMYTHKEC